MPKQGHRRLDFCTFFWPRDSESEAWLFFQTLKHSLPRASKQNCARFSALILWWTTWSGVHIRQSAGECVNVCTWLWCFKVHSLSSDILQCLTFTAQCSKLPHMLYTRVETEQTYAAGMIHGTRFTHHLTMHKGQKRNDHSRHTHSENQCCIYNQVQQHVHYLGLLINQF